MRNPPDFVMYVVMVKAPPSKKFSPLWYRGGGIAFAEGFANKEIAEMACEVFRDRYGKKNAYVQQYGPYK